MQQPGGAPTDAPTDDPAASPADRPGGAAPRQTGSRPRATAPRVLPLVAATVLVVTALATALPGAAGLAGTVPLAQLLPFRGVLALGLLVSAGLVLALRALARLVLQPRGPRRAPRGRRRAPSATAVLAAGLVLAAAVHAGVLAARGVLPAAPSAGGTDLVVLSLNTERGGADAQQVAAAVAAAGADVVVLPETPATTARQVVSLLGEQGRGYSASTATTSPNPTHATSLLVADRLGTPAAAPAPAVELAAVAASAPTLPGPVVAVHPVAPVPQDGMVERWRSDVPRAVAACTAAPGAVVAGDFNATLDHPGLRDLGPCVDAAAAAGAGGLGTWPSTVPQLLAAPIDHVLVDGRTWRVLSAQVVTVGATDHRGLVVHLARR